MLSIQTIHNNNINNNNNNNGGGGGGGFGGFGGNSFVVMVDAAFLYSSSVQSVSSLSPSSSKQRIILSKQQQQQQHHHHHHLLIHHKNPTTKPITTTTTISNTPDPSTSTSTSSMSKLSSASSSSSKQQPFLPPPPPPPIRHVAFLCDGNSRWAQRQNLPTVCGHKQGADRLVQLIEHLTELPAVLVVSKEEESSSSSSSLASSSSSTIDYITLYGFSTENWNRPQQEIQDIFRVMEITAKTMLATINHNQSDDNINQQRTRPRPRRPIQVRILGDLEDPRIPVNTRMALRHLEQATAPTTTTTTTTGQNNNNHHDNHHHHHHHNNTTLTVCLAINYGGRQDIVRACRAIATQVADGTLTVDDITTNLIEGHLWTASIPSPDLVVRTSGECRLSNFLLWDVAYTELYFTDTLWPDFDIPSWQQAVLWYGQRQRRFGTRQQETINKSEVK
ncbi:undecaprenyl pyrophosphate synthetase [Nitzschia inconspicua]|uniref:Undecaprenyl pyrophosphate synthetase n=1 Tax=Nitzschia inconspicua TaxID=303405 RepID=A0A9K3LKM4_9STRA|nr:undecaprenyl pyrophosphate synthetase [Nitzschia inconspicua]